MLLFGPFDPFGFSECDYSLYLELMKIDLVLCVIFNAFQLVNIDIWICCNPCDPGKTFFKTSEEQFI